MALKIYALALVGILKSTAVGAQGVYTVGEIDCGTWLTARQNNSSIALESYAQGMINGLSVGSGISVWDARSVPVTREQAWFWIDNHCRQNPLNNLTQAILRFADAMTNGKYSQRYLPPPSR